MELVVKQMIRVWKLKLGKNKRRIIKLYMN